MSASPSPVSPSTIVARLRAAGCVFAEDEARLVISAARTPGELDDMVCRRIAGLPLEYVLGWAGFRGMRIAVEPGVFVPRRRTEFLVSEAIDIATPGVVIVDLCCGSGAVGIAIAAALDRAELHATDIDPAAVKCAGRNVATNTSGQVYEGDLYEPLPASLQGRVDILVANTPYVPTDDIRLMPPEARLHEPRMALDGGPDGLDVQRRVALEAPRWLAPGGYLLIETSERQAVETVGALNRSGLNARVSHHNDLAATVVIGRMPRVEKD